MSLVGMAQVSMSQVSHVLEGVTNLQIFHCLPSCHCIWERERDGESFTSPHTGVFQPTPSALLPATYMCMCSTCTFAACVRLAHPTHSLHVCVLLTPHIRCTCASCSPHTFAARVCLAHPAHSLHVCVLLTFGWVSCGSFRHSTGSCV